MLRSFAVPLLLACLTLTTFAQSPHEHMPEETAGMIDGAKTPDLIPDSTGQRLYLLGISHFDTENRAAYVDNNIGLPDPDRTVMINQIAEWATAYHAMVNEYNASGLTASALSNFKDGQARVTTAAFAYLLANLSAEGWMQLQRDYQHSKRGMKVSDEMNTPTQQMGVSVNLVNSDSTQRVPHNKQRTHLAHTSRVTG